MRLMNAMMWLRCPATPTFMTWVITGIATTVSVIHPASTARAQFGPQPGISVDGVGEVKTKPDVVEINLRLVARGELTDDAVVKHRDARKRTTETFLALKLDNLKLEEKDLNLRPGNAQEMMQMMWNGMPPSQNKRTQVEIASMLRARLVNVGKIPTEELMSTIGKLIDAAQDSGAGLGVSDSDMMMMRYYGYGVRQTPLVKFVVTNLTELREKAYELAVADARKRAERLARLNGVKLGAVIAVDEVDSSRQNVVYNYVPFNNDDAAHEKEELVAESMMGGKITVHLRVRFGIDGAKEQVSSLEPKAGTPVAAVEAKGETP